MRTSNLIFTSPGSSKTRALLLIVLIVAIMSGCDTSSGGPSGSGGPPTSTGNNKVPLINPSGEIPEQANKPQPPTNNFQGCPSSGDGGLNTRKNRTDSAPWYPVAIKNILALQWPQDIEGRPRSGWSLEDVTAIRRYEGIPVQVEGWLAGAKQQGPESCNCHSVNDVDNHLWIVDAPNKDRSQSVVVEVTPRLRAIHPGWAFGRIRPLVDGKTKVRISGWLMLDQEHPDQVGKTRGSIWEIHPIIGFDVLRGNSWVTLDTGGASTNSSVGSAVPPTEDPNLPPTVSDPLDGATIPTATPLKPQGQSGGVSTSNGTIKIDDIFFNGVKGSSEPDEYVEIANVSTQPVNMDGWVLRDVYGSQKFTWHNFTLQGQKRIRVYTNEVHAESGGFSFGASQPIWSNKGDAAELVDGSGTVVGTFAYGDKK